MLMTVTRGGSGKKPEWFPTLFIREGGAFWGQYNGIVDKLPI